MEAGKDPESRYLWVGLVCLLLLTPMKTVVAQDYSTLDVREKLVVANNILAMEGLVGPFGHVSVRMQEEGKFRISDHRSPNEVTVDHIKEVKIDITPEAVEDQDLYREVFIHSSIYRELPEVNAVVHTHAPYAVALGTLQRSQHKVLPTTNPGANLGNFIPVFQSVGLISTPERGMELARTLQGQDGVLLRGHGTVVVGATLEQAVLRAIYLEFEARTQIRSHSAGEPIPYTDGESDLFKRTVAVEHAWHYYVDKFWQSEKKKP
jgi:HCOMODA/2-hydroxy-3-carboxy-muconic semialdehyde decarboxylase